jgi:hypothetical protein
MWMWSSSRSRSSVQSLARWVLWLPVLMVGSLLYWTVALGLGGLSLIAASALSVVPPTSQVEFETTTGITAGDVMQSIPVQLEESVEPEDVDGNTGSGFSPASEDNKTVAPPGPGITAF